MATSEERERLEAMANAIMAPHVMEQIQEREKLRSRNGRFRLLRILGGCMLVGLAAYMILK